MVKWVELCESDNSLHSAARNLLLLKRAIKTVTMAIQAEGEAIKAESYSDQLSVCIRLLRNLDRGRWDLVQRGLKDYPEVLRTIDIKACAEGKGPALEKLKEEIIRLARKEVEDEMRDLFEDIGGH